MTSQSFIKVMDFQDGPFVVYHYEIISSTHNINLSGKHNSGKPANELSPPSGSIATGLSRYAGIDEGPPSPSGSGFFMRKGD